MTSHTGEQTEEVPAINPWLERITALQGERDELRQDLAEMNCLRAEQDVFAREVNACLGSMTTQRDGLRAAMHKIKGLAEAEYGTNDAERDTLLDIAAVCGEAL